MVYSSSKKKKPCSGLPWKLIRIPLDPAVNRRCSESRVSSELFIFFLLIK
ncbi:hypothetical protein YC2023_042183 [Brassica napus]